MRYGRLFRFILVTFVVGSAIGLMSGLVFGGPADPGGSGGNAAAVAGTGSTSSGKTASPSGPTTTSPLATSPVTPEQARAIGANELGQIMVLEYHLIGPGEATSQYTRTPENLRKDVALLKSEGYYPINIRDLATGNIEVPAGKSPVVLTFDDSSEGQYRLLDDGTLDPDSAVGILQAAVAQGGWAARATFFPLLDVDAADRIVFGQPERKKEKLQNLVSWGYEVGSHTVTHLDLKKASSSEIKKQLYTSQNTLQTLIGGDYKLVSLSVPFGSYPSNDSILASGTYEGKPYQYEAAVEVAGGSAPSPFSTGFEPLHIPRIQVTGNALKTKIEAFKKQPELRYVSDGDPAAISVPESPASKLGALQENLGRPVVRY